MCYSKTNVVIAIGIKRIWELKKGTHSSARIIQYVNMELKEFEFFYRASGSVVDGLADNNGHKPEVVSEGKCLSWGGERTKGKWCGCKLTKEMFLHSDLLNFCLNTKQNITKFFPDTTMLNN